MFYRYILVLLYMYIQTYAHTKYIQFYNYFTSFPPLLKISLSLSFLVKKYIFTDKFQIYIFSILKAHSIPILPISRVTLCFLLSINSPLPYSHTQYFIKISPLLPLTSCKRNFFFSYRYIL